MIDLKTKFNKFLEYDGSLRDILVMNTNLDDWEILYDYLLKSDYEIHYKKNGDKISLPKNIDQLFTEKNHSHSFEIQKENILFMLHIFSDASEIELDLDPRDFIAEDQYLIILELMDNISKTLSKEVILTYENSREDIFYSINKS